jgi:hypothetical protein
MIGDLCVVTAGGRSAEADFAKKDRRLKWGAVLCFLEVTAIRNCGKYGREPAMADFRVVSGEMRPKTCSFRPIRKIQRTVFRGVAGDFNRGATD